MEFANYINADLINMILTVAAIVMAMCIACAVMKISVMWYYAVGAVVLGFFVSYAAMFGFDKFKEAWDKLKLLKQ